MNADQKARANQLLSGFLNHDWVQLRAVVAFANEAVGFDDLRVSTPEAREFVSDIILTGRVVAGSLNTDAKFVAWSGGRNEHLAQVLEEMPLGTLVDEAEEIWFDKPEGIG